jgi:GT2 family glycosyltransferase
MTIAVLMTCFSRVQTTIRCLQHLFACKLPSGVKIEVWLVDDASTDETGRKVMEQYPSVNVIQGTGSLYWCGGMRLAWTIASRAKDYDGYLWLNDDTMLFETGLIDVLEPSLEMAVSDKIAAVTCGCICDEEHKKTTYGGRLLDGSLCNPSGHIQSVPIINGNCVFVPREVFRIVGNFSHYFTHALGDYDYGLRAIRKGALLYLTSRYVGSCDNKNPLVEWVDPRVPCLRRLHNLYSPKGSATPITYFRFNLIHAGLLSAVTRFALQHIRVCFPQWWKNVR